MASALPNDLFAGSSIPDKYLSPGIQSEGNSFMSDEPSLTFDSPAPISGSNRSALKVKFAKDVFIEGLATPVTKNASPTSSSGADDDTPPHDASHMSSKRSSSVAAAANSFIRETNAWMERVKALEEDNPDRFQVTTASDRRSVMTEELLGVSEIPPIQDFDDDFVTGEQVLKKLEEDESEFVEEHRLSIGDAEIDGSNALAEGEPNLYNLTPAREPRSADKSSSDKEHSASGGDTHETPGRFSPTSYFRSKSTLEDLRGYESPVPLMRLSDSDRRAELEPMGCSGFSEKSSLEASGSSGHSNDSRIKGTAVSLIPPATPLQYDAEKGLSSPSLEYLKAKFESGAGRNIEVDRSAWAAKQPSTNTTKISDRSADSGRTSVSHVSDSHTPVAGGRESISTPYRETPNSTSASLAHVSGSRTLAGMDSTNSSSSHPQGGPSERAASTSENGTRRTEGVGSDEDVDEHSEFSEENDGSNDDNGADVASEVISAYLTTDKHLVDFQACIEGSDNEQSLQIRNRHPTQSLQVHLQVDTVQGALVSPATPLFEVFSSNMVDHNNSREFKPVKQVIIPAKGAVDVTVKFSPALPAGRSAMDQSGSLTLSAKVLISGHRYHSERVLVCLRGVSLTHPLEIPVRNGTLDFGSNSVVLSSKGYGHRAVSELAIPVINRGLQNCKLRVALLGRYAVHDAFSIRVPGGHGIETSPLSPRSGVADLIVDPGSSTIFRVAFHPPTAAEFLATLRITDVISGASKDVELRGLGVLADNVADETTNVSLGESRSPIIHHGLEKWIDALMDMPNQVSLGTFAVGLHHQVSIPLPVQNVPELSEDETLELRLELSSTDGHRVSAFGVPTVIEVSKETSSSFDALPVAFAPRLAGHSQAILRIATLRDVEGSGHYGNLDTTSASSSTYGDHESVDGGRVVQLIKTIHIEAEAVVPTFELRPWSVLDFGTVEYFDRAVKKVEVTNTCPASIRIQVAVSDDDSENRLSYSLSPGETSDGTTLLLENGENASGDACDKQDASHAALPRRLTLNISPYSTVCLSVRFQAFGYSFAQGCRKYKCNLTFDPVVVLRGSDTVVTAIDVPVQTSVGFSRLQVQEKYRNTLEFACSEGETATHEIPLRNAGTIPTEVKVSTLSSAFKVTPTILELGPETTGVVTVSFRPSATEYDDSSVDRQPIADDLVLRTRCNSYRLPMVATHDVLPTLLCDRPIVNFGCIALHRPKSGDIHDSTSQQCVCLRNQGVKKLHISISIAETSVEKSFHSKSILMSRPPHGLSGDGDTDVGSAGESGVWKLLSASIQTLQPGEFVRIVVQARPREVKTYRRWLQIRTNGGVKYTIPMVCYGGRADVQLASGFEPKVKFGTVGEGCVSDQTIGLTNHGDRTAFVVVRCKQEEGRQGRLGLSPPALLVRPRETSYFSVRLVPRSGDAMNPEWSRMRIPLSLQWSEEVVRQQRRNAKAAFHMQHAAHPITDLHGMHANHQAGTGSAEGMRGFHQLLPCTGSADTSVAVNYPGTAEAIPSFDRFDDSFPGESTIPLYDRDHGATNGYGRAIMWYNYELMRSQAFSDSSEEASKVVADDEHFFRRSLRKLAVTLTGSVVRTVSSQSRKTLPLSSSTKANASHRSKRVPSKAGDRWATPNRLAMEGVIGDISCVDEGVQETELESIPRPATVQGSEVPNDEFSDSSHPNLKKITFPAISPSQLVHSTLYIDNPFPVSMPWSIVARAPPVVTEAGSTKRIVYSESGQPTFRLPQQSGMVPPSGCVAIPIEFHAGSEGLYEQSFMFTYPSTEGDGEDMTISTTLVMAGKVTSPLEQPQHRVAREARRRIEVSEADM